MLRTVSWVGTTLKAQLTEESVMDMKLELVAVPVSDVDRAKAFYVDQVGFVADVDQTVSDDIRFVQLTPPGSACSIAFGRGIVDSAPGFAEGSAARRRRRGRQRVTSSPGAGSRCPTCRTSRGAGSCTSPTPTATPGRCSSSRAR